MSRFTAFAAALALLASGIAIGALGTFLLLERPRPPGPMLGPPPPDRAFMDELEQRLALTPEQRDAIERILREGRREGEEIRHELRPRLERQIDATRERIDALLTPEQRDRFAALRREQRRRIDRFLLDGPPPPGPPGPE